MASKYTFENVNGTIIRIANISGITTRPLNSYQSLNARYYYSNDDKTAYSADFLIASGIIPSGLDYYMFGPQLYEYGTYSGFTVDLKRYSPNAKIIQYVADFSPSIFNYPYQGSLSNNRRITELFADNLIQIKFDASNGSRASWKSWYAKYTPSIVTGTDSTIDLGTYMQLYPSPGKFYNNTAETYYWPSGVDIEWKWESKLPNNSGLVLSGILTGYHDNFVMSGGVLSHDIPVAYAYNKLVGLVHRQSGDYFPPTNRLWPYNKITTHGDVTCYWGGSPLDPVPTKNYNYIFSSGIQIYTKALNGTLDPWYNPIDFWMLDGPIGTYLQDNRSNPSGLVSSQTKDDDPYHFGYKFANYYFWRYIGYVDYAGNYDPTDVENTTWYGVEARRGDGRAEGQEGGLQISRRRMKSGWQDAFPEKIIYNGIDVDTVVDDEIYISNFGSSEFRERNDYIYDEASYHHVGGWTYWWDWTHNQNDTWYFVNRYRPKNCPAVMYMDFMSSVTPTEGGYPLEGEMQPYQGYYGQALSILTDFIYSIGRAEGVAGEILENNIVSTETRLKPQITFRDRKYYRKFEIGDPLNDPYLDGNTIKRDFTNGYVHVLNSGVDLREPWQVFHAAKIKTYQLRDLEIPSLWGAWISDENFGIQGKKNGLVPIPTLSYLDPELGSGPRFNSVENTTELVLAGVGAWYPSIDFDITQSGIFTAETPNGITWPEFTAYVYAYFDSSTAFTGDLISHYRTNGQASFKFGRRRITSIFDYIDFKIYTQYYPNGVSLSAIGSTLFNKWNLFTLQYKSGDARLYINGNLSASSSVISGTLLGTYANDYDLSIGGESALGFYTRHFNGKLATLIIASGFHDTATRTSIQDSLTRRYTRQY